MTSRVSILLPTSNQTLCCVVNSEWQEGMKHGPFESPKWSSQCIYAGAVSHREFDRSRDGHNAWCYCLYLGLVEGLLKGLRFPDSCSNFKCQCLFLSIAHTRCLNFIFLLSLQMVSYSSVLTAISKVRPQPLTAWVGGRETEIQWHMGPHLLDCSDHVTSGAGARAQRTSGWHGRLPLESGAWQLGANFQHWKEAECGSCGWKKDEQGSWRCQLPHVGDGDVGWPGHSIASPLISPQFDDFSRDLCVQALLDIMDMFCDRLR